MGRQIAHTKQLSIEQFLQPTVKDVIPKILRAVKNHHVGSVEFVERYLKIQRNQFNYILHAKTSVNRTVHECFINTKSFWKIGIVRGCASKKRCSTNACASQLLALLGGHALATDCLKKLANLELFSTPVYGNEVQNPVMIAGSSTSKSSSVPNVILRRVSKNLVTLRSSESTVTATEDKPKVGQAQRKLTGANLTKLGQRGKFTSHLNLSLNIGRSQIDNLAKTIVKASAKRIANKTAEAIKSNTLKLSKSPKKKERRQNLKKTAGEGRKGDVEEKVETVHLSSDGVDGDQTSKIVQERENCSPVGPSDNTVLVGDVLYKVLELSFVSY